MKILQKYSRITVNLQNMSDTLTPDQRHRNMAAIHSASTRPELKLRHALWQLGFRYRMNDRKLPGKPDIVLPKYRTVIFVHGCFWHGHNGCKFYTVPKTNTDFWTAKIARNQERDQVVWRQLESKGWNVIIVWECELKNDSFLDTLSSVESKLQANLTRYLQEREDRRIRREEWREELKRRKERSEQVLTVIKR